MREVQTIAPALTMGLWGLSAGEEMQVRNGRSEAALRSDLTNFRVIKMISHTL